MRRKRGKLCINRRERKVIINLENECFRSADKRQQRKEDTF